MIFNIKYTLNSILYYYYNLRIFDNFNFEIQKL